MTGPTIGTLLDAVTSRDAEAFATLVERFDDDLVRLAFVISSDLATAEDAAQATWERLWRRPPRLQSPDKLRSWLLTVAANEARTSLRRRRRRQEIEAVVRRSAEGRTTDRRDAMLDVEKAVSRLSRQEREIVGLRFALDLPAAAIAAHLGLTESGARVRLHRAIQKLRKDLADE